MPNRREFLASAAAAGAASLAAGRALANADKTQAQPPTSSGDGTWLTYAVNVEMTWTKLPFLERLKKVRESGFSHFEFWPWRNKDIDAILQLSKELSLVPVQFSASPKRFDQGITDPKRKQEFIDDITAAVPVAKKLGVKKMCVVAGEETAGLSRDEQTQAVIDALKAGARIIEPEGITIILEPLNVLVNHPKQLIVTSAHAARVLTAVGSPNVKMLFDIYHQQISEGNLSGNIRKYKDLIGYFQMADHPGRHEPGTGEINYAHVLRVIHDIGYRDPIGMEMSPMGDPMNAFKAVREADVAARERG
jgi:hydroxypyruvate isomerase